MATKTQISAALTQAQVQNSTKSFNLSKEYAKKLLRIGTLNLLYKRIDIPEEEFIIKKFEGIPYVLFKRKSSDNFIKYYHVISSGIIDALEKDYLKEIFMHILNKKTGQLLEKYNFKIKYNKDDSQSKVKSNKVKNATIEFLQAIADLSGTKFRSDEVELAVELQFHDMAPRDYQPPNFQDSHDPICINSETERIINLCDINTGFHKIKCYGSGITFNESRTSITSGTSTHVELEDPSLREFPVNKNGADERSDITEFVEEQTEKSIADFSEMGSVTENVSISTDVSINCPCVWELENEYETVKCSTCYGLVHLACHGYLTKDAVDETVFKCFLCSYRNDDNEFDNVKLLMKLRIILYGIYQKRQFPSEILQLGSVKERSFVLNRLDTLKILKSSPNSACDIDFDRLNEAIAQTFTTQSSQYL